MSLSLQKTQISRNFW